MPNGNERGSSYDRRARRAWLLSAEAGFGGDGDKVPCWECGAMVTGKTLVVDRIVPSHQGGRYRRDNIRPHCLVCSCREGMRTMTALRRGTDPYDDTDHCRDCRRHYLAEHIFGCAWIGPWDDISTPIGPQ